LGARFGDGLQYWSYVSLHDEVAAIRHLLDRDDLSGPFNVTAPQPLTNREITAAMGRVLHRPAVLAVPAPVLRTALGAMAGEVLGSTRVLPMRLLESGFVFAFPGIEDTIRAALD
jgi:NAD dependent epimerase/dehydratase family enzyme